MADRTIAGTRAAEAWALDAIFDTEGPVIATGADLGPQDQFDSEPEDDTPPEPVALDDPEPPAGVTGPGDVNAGAKRTLLWLGSGVALLAVLIVLAFLVLGGGPTPTPSPQHKAATTPVVSAVPTTTAESAPQQDQAIPYTPQTDSCPGGPTSPLTLTDPTAETAWVCSRGPQESRVDGQVLHVKFVCARTRPDSACSYMLNSVSITPGWVAKSGGGQDEWLQHRVVTRVQFNFYNGDELAADPFFVDTNSVHGPVPATLPGKILASRVDVIILHTERPPAAPAPNPAAGQGDGLAPPPGLLDSVVGGGDPAPATPPGDLTAADGAGSSDPVDATFAVSQLQFFGHSPN